MTPEQINVAIAESLGYRYEKGEEPVYGGRYQPEGWYQPNASFERGWDSIPNYPESLNACAEFERTLTEDEFDRYAIILWDLIADTEEAQKPGRNALSCFIRGATAPQRCEAYLRVKGLRIEEGAKS